MEINYFNAEGLQYIAELKKEKRQATQSRPSWQE